MKAKILMKNSKWKNRIVGEGEKPAKDFNLNALNWRTHPDIQREAMIAILGEIGWVQRVLVNVTTGNILDGHLRVEEALKKGENTPVPYVQVKLTEAEERKILALFDKISAMAGKDVEKYQELTELTEFESPVLDAILNDRLGEDFNLEDFYKEALPVEKTEFIIEIICREESEYRNILDELAKIDSSPKKAVKKLLSL